MKYTIGELAEIIDGDRGKNYPQQHEFFDSGYCLFLNTGNVTTAGFSFQFNQFITKEKCDILRKGKLQRGDIVYTQGELWEMRFSIMTESHMNISA